jgi:hypothetical protein
MVERQSGNTMPTETFDFDVGQFPAAVRPRVVSNWVQQAGRSVQAGAALAPGISQQAIKHPANIEIAGVIPGRVTPISEIPIDGAGFGN